MSNLLNLYRTQVRILWNWRGGWWALTKRIIITLLVATVAFMATAFIVPGIAVVRVVDAVIAVSLMGLFNVLVRPLLLSIVAPRSLVLTGILVIVLQVLVFLVVAPIAPGVQVDTFLSALIGSFIYAAINTTLTAILGVDRGGSFFGLLVSNLLSSGAAAKTDQPGVVIIQIDGLAHPILAGRVRAGSVNTLAGWIRSGSHVLSRVGGDPAVDDVGQPGRDPAREQRRDPGVPLVRARSKEADGLEQPRRRGGDRQARVQRRRPPVEQRRQHLQSRHG